MLAERNENPNAGIIDSRSVKTSEKGPSGFDNGKKIKGRKKHMMVDPLGLLIGCCVTTANISDNQGAKEFAKRFYLPCIQKVWADQAYDGYPLKQIYAENGIRLEIVKRSEKGEVSPKDGL